MSRADIPPSAVDFHVSSIIEEVVNTSEIAHKAKVYTQQFSAWFCKAGEPYRI